VKTLHLFLTAHWFDLTEQDKKPVEYRRMGTRMEKQILSAKPGDLVAYHRGYTSNVCVRRITKIDIGPCPIEGWYGDFYRIHSERIEKTIFNTGDKAR